MSTRECCLYKSVVFIVYMFFFFNDTATTEIYTLSLHDALPILHRPFVRLRPRQLALARRAAAVQPGRQHLALPHRLSGDRKSTRLNSSHANISYAVFCLKKKKQNIQTNNLHRLIM